MERESERNGNGNHTIYFGHPIIFLLDRMGYLEFA